MNIELNLINIGIIFEIIIVITLFFFIKGYLKKERKQPSMPKSFIKNLKF
tara:strand:- start:2773 stop:2922 length:150 start_codon:yes stop_codon:yes gene_type:complete